MKDASDNQTLDYFGFPVKALAAPVPQGRSCEPEQRKPKRLPRQSIHHLPAGATPASSGEVLGWSRSVVPVATVARDWGISSRRVRVMLTEQRLEGRQLENGYWEVFYPYRYVFGTRGPAIKRQRDLPEQPKKRVRNQDW